MTTVGEGSTLSALDLLFGPDADAAETLAGEILSPGGDQSLGRAIAHLSEPTRQAAAQEAATTMAALFATGWNMRLSARSCASMAAKRALSGTLAAFSSPKNFTKPPSGIADIFQRVPCRSLNPISSGPKPIENTKTRTPHQRATRKWPSS